MYKPKNKFKYGRVHKKNKINALKTDYKYITQNLELTDIEEINVNMNDCYPGNHLKKNSKLFSYLPHTLKKMEIFIYVDDKTKINKIMNLFSQLPINLYELFIESNKNIMFHFTNLPVAIKQIKLKNGNIDAKSKIPIGTEIILL